MEAGREIIDRLDQGQEETVLASELWTANWRPSAYGRKIIRGLKPLEARRPRRRSSRRSASSRHSRASSSYCRLPSSAQQFASS